MSRSVGIWSRSASTSEHGTFGGELHAERDRAAMDAGVLMKCPGVRPRETSAKGGAVEDEQASLPFLTH